MGPRAERGKLARGAEPGRTATEQVNDVYFAVRSNGSGRRGILFGALSVGGRFLGLLTWFWSLTAWWPLLARRIAPSLPRKRLAHAATSVIPSISKPFQWTLFPHYFFMSPDVFSAHCSDCVPTCFFSAALSISLPAAREGSIFPYQPVAFFFPRCQIGRAFVPACPGNTTV